MASQYKPGDKVEHSGIYRVIHDRKHAQEHEVTVVFGKRFPPCNGCGDHPRFVPAKLAIHIESDDNFKVP